MNLTKSEKLIKKNLAELRKLIETTKDPVEARIAYCMEHAIRWMILDTEGWGKLVDEAILEADLLKGELPVK